MSSNNAEDEVNNPSKKSPQPATEPKGKSFLQKIKSFSISFVAFFLIIFILYLIFRKKPIKIFTTPIPFVFSSNILQPFESFLNSKEKSDILVYYGKDGYGKSRFLSIAEEQLLKDYYFVIKCDFSVLTEDSTELDVITILKDGIISAVANCRYPNRLKQQHLLIESLSAALNTTNAHPVTGIRDQTLQSIAFHLCSFIDGILKNAPISSAFVNALDSLGPSVFLINEPQRALHIHPVLCRALLNELFKTSVGSNNVGCICEVSDLDFIKRHSGTPHVHFIEVGEFSLEDARTYLKGTFKPRQITELYNKFGGRGKYYAKVYEMIRDGKVSFAKSIENVQINDN